MPKVSEAHREMQRQRILDAALSCVARKGFASTSMADIIAEAGLSAGAVYVYYRSKEQLTVDVGRRVLNAKIAVLDGFLELDEVPAPAVAIPEFLAQMPRDGFFPDVAVQVWGEAIHSPELRETARGLISEVSGHFAAYLAAWFRQSRGLGEKEALAEGTRVAPAAVGLVQGYMVQSVFSDDAARQRYREAGAALLAGL
ncbi:TetR/AcrR family transcriptional regulator [Arthrobacter cupressi]|uniref:Transcriptional regulator, TetR family n=1 Tax=Arthrobacter cupressi TaxID=1045773 RepID=A0A1G8VI43_9MICC|nr:TetR/AcrR family transcriptional regulator [Arthrobacter cupressi]NYD79460.1 AcrR family transcriptional regulator [Arthrobacter cupressi]SDJ65639.1 transcriptional regulator, TetR family [Arthrobacter cupressi]